MSTLTETEIKIKRMEALVNHWGLVGDKKQITLITS